MYRFIEITSFLELRMTAGWNLGPGEDPVKMGTVITLTTDFGVSDPYVGIVKGVILGICPGAALVDLTHGVDPQDILGAALALEAARPYFPRGTVHVAVVDPGVGTDRRALVAVTERDVLVAPDNGLLSFLPAGEIREVRAIENPALTLQPVSRTFHGRDVFAPVAAHLASGVAPSEVGPRLASIVRVPFPEAVVSAGEVCGEVVAFDRFGNALTSIREADLPAGHLAVAAGEHLLLFAPTYGAVAPGGALALVGSSGRLELSVRDGNAREALDLRRGMRVEVHVR